MRDLTEHLQHWGRFGDPAIDDPHWQKLLAALDPDRQQLVELVTGEEIRVMGVGGQLYPLADYGRQPYRNVYLPMSLIKLVRDQPGGKLSGGSADQQPDARPRQDPCGR